MIYLKGINDVVSKSRRFAQSVPQLEPLDVAVTTVISFNRLTFTFRAALFRNRQFSVTLELLAVY